MEKYINITLILPYLSPQKNCFGNEKKEKRATAIILNIFLFSINFNKKIMINDLRFF